MSFGVLDIEILACKSTKIATPLLEVESGFNIFIVMVGIVFESCVYSAASTVGFLLALWVLTKDWSAFSRGVKKVVYDNWIIIEWSQVLVSEGVKGGRRSVFVGLALATALAIAVDNVTMFRSVDWLVSTISTVGGLCTLLFEENVVVVLVGCSFWKLVSIDLYVVEGSVISSIDEILAEDRSVVRR